MTDIPPLRGEIVRQFPNIARVAITLRQSVSASHNNWGAMLYVAGEDRAYFAPLQDGKDARRMKSATSSTAWGAGDAFAAGLIFAIASPLPLGEGRDEGPQAALDFATAASCLVHTIEGDFNCVSRSEIESLVKGSASGRVVR